MIDYPNSSKAKKLYLCLFTGGAPVHMPLPLGLDSSQQVVANDTNTCHCVYLESVDYLLMYLTECILKKLLIFKLIILTGFSVN